MSVRQCDSFKESGAEWLGSIPDHWSALRIKTLFEIRKRIAGELGHDVLSVTQQGLKVRDADSNDGQLSMDYSKYQLVEPGDFVMNHMDLLTGYVDQSSWHGVTSPDYRVFTARTGNLAPKFFLYLFQNGYRQKIFYAFGQGASGLGRWRMPTDSFNDFILPVPPLSEQTAIAAFLDRETGKIDALLEEQKRLIELLKEKRQSVISHAVTKGLNPDARMTYSGIEWLGAVPQHWSMGTLKRLVSATTSGPRGWSELTADEGAVFFQSQNIGRSMEVVLDGAKRINPTDDAESRRCRLQTDDVVVCITGGRTAAVAHVEVISEPTYVNQHVCLIRPKAVLGRYLAYWLSSFGGQKQLQLSMYGLKQGLSLDDIRNQILPIPNSTEQHEIVAHLDKETTKFSALISQAEYAIEILRERRTALISAAVTGKIDVRDVAEAKRMTA